MAETRKCPYCAEEIAVEALRCRYCRGRVAALDPERWHRSHPDRRLAGVAAALGYALALPVNAVRLGFIVLTFVTHVGPVLYGALWLLIPFAPGGSSPLERGLVRALDWLARLRSVPPGPPPETRRENGSDRTPESARPPAHRVETTLPGGPPA